MVYGVGLVSAGLVDQMGREGLGCDWVGFLFGSRVRISGRDSSSSPVIHKNFGDLSLSSVMRVRISGGSRGLCENENVDERKRRKQDAETTLLRRERDRQNFYSKRAKKTNPDPRPKLKSNPVAVQTFRAI